MSPSTSRTGPIGNTLSRGSCRQFRPRPEHQRCPSLRGTIGGVEGFGAKCLGIVTLCRHGALVAERRLLLAERLSVYAQQEMGALEAFEVDRQVWFQGVLDRPICGCIVSLCLPPPDPAQNA